MKKKQIKEPKAVYPRCEHLQDRTMGFVCKKSNTYVSVLECMNCVEQKPPVKKTITEELPQCGQLEKRDTLFWCKQNGDYTDILTCYGCQKTTHTSPKKLPKPVLPIPPKLSGLDQFIRKKTP